MSVLAGDVIDDVVSKRRYYLMLKSPVIESFAMMRFMGFFAGDGPEINLSEPLEIDSRLVKVAAKRLPELVHAMLVRKAEKIIQI